VFLFFYLSYLSLLFSSLASIGIVSDGSKNVATTTQKMPSAPSSWTSIIHQLSLEGRQGGFTSSHVVLFV